jgi:hypothetical protein
MPAVREQIMQAALAALQAAGTASGFFVRRNPRTEIGAHGFSINTELPAVLLWDGEHRRVKSLGPGVDDWILRFDVEICVTATEANWGTALSDLYALVANALYAWAVSGPVAGDLVHDIEEIGMSAPEFMRDDGVGAFVAATIEFAAVYWTKEADVTQKGP